MTLNETNETAEEIVSIYFSVIGIEQMLSKFETMDKILEDIFNKQFSAIRKRLIELDTKFELYVPDISGVHPGLQGILAAIGIARNVIAPKLMGYTDYLQRLTTFANLLLGSGQSNSSGFLLDILPILHKSRLNEEWMRDALLLTMMEVLITQKLEALKIDYSKLDFYSKLKAIQERASEKNTKIDDMMPKALYNIRNRVLHEGKNLSLVEFESVKNFMNSFVDQILRV